MVEILSAHSPKTLILASRTPAKIQEIIDTWKPSSPGVTYIPVTLDLGSQKSVREAAASILSNSQIEQIDILFNNAAVMTIPERTLSPEGIEIQFATNHIGHFLFTNLIMPKILAAAKSNPRGGTRIVNVASRGCVYSPVRFSDLNFDKTNESLSKDEQPAYDAVTISGRPIKPTDTYGDAVAYGQSKTANVLFSLSLTSKLYEKYGVLSYGLHPGAIMTELARHINSDQVANIREKFKDTFLTVDQGCATSLRAGLDGSLEPADFRGNGKGIYLLDVQIAEAPGWAQNPRLAERLWEVSERLVGEKFEL